MLKLYKYLIMASRALIAALFIVSGVEAQITSVFPTQNALNIAPSANITVTFGFEADATSLTNSTIRVYGSQSGLHTAIITYDNISKTATINPNSDFRFGETASVILTTAIKDSNGSSMLSAYSWNFMISVEHGTGSYRQTQIATVGVAGQSIYSIDIGDIDNDGDLDLAAANQVANNVAFLKNNGDGLFSLSSSISVGVSPYSLIITDLDNDGDQDAASSNGGSNTLSILKNDGNGNFALSSSPNAGNSLVSVIDVDVDNDGDLDLAVTNRYMDSVSILLNDGNANFTIGSAFRLTGNPRSIGTGDIDNDGDIDLAVTNESASSVSLLKNNGSGIFSLSSSPTVGSYPNSVQMVDFDGDGDIDLAVSNSTSYSVSILTNDGTGNFTLTASPSVSSFPESINIGDVDNDGDVDLAITHAGSGNVITLLKNNGTGSFTSSSFQNINAPDGAIGDIDGDGDIDLAVVNFPLTSIVVLQNRNSTQEINLIATNHDYGFSKIDSSKDFAIKITNEGASQPLQINSITSSNSVFTANPTTASIAAGETLTVTVSFKPTDIVTYSDSLVISSNDPNRPNVAFYVTGSGDPVSSVSPAANALNVPPGANISVTFGFDVNASTLSNSTIRINSSQTGLHPAAFLYNSGTRTVTINPDKDFAVGEIVTVTLTTGIQTASGDPMPTAYSSSFTIAVSGGSGVYERSSFLTVGQYPQESIIVDLNNDGDKDIATTCTGSGILSILSNDNHGGFTVGSLPFALDGPFSLAAGDLDMDGDIDLILTSSSSNAISIFKRNGDGSYSLSSTPGTAIPIAAAIADLDMDGDLDLVTVKYSSNLIAIFKNDGTGNLSLTDSVVVGPDPHAIAIGDMDNDGDPDLFTTNWGNNSVSILQNDGTGVFSVAAIAFDGLPLPVSVGDLDNDGDIDIVTASSSGESNTVTILKNSRENGFVTLSPLIAGTLPHDIALGDVDGDGDLDIVTADYGSNTISILINHGNMNFTKALSVNVDNSPNSVKMGDLNGDGSLDIVATNYWTDRVTILLNKPAIQNISLSSNMVNFGLVKSNSGCQSSYRIRNNGGSNPLTVSNIVSSNPSVFSVNPQSGTINAQDSMTVTVTFTPAAAGVYHDSLTIFSNDPDEPEVKVYLTGSGAPSVVSSVPSKNAYSANRTTNVSAAFTDPMGTIPSSAFMVFGEISGMHRGSITYDAFSKTATLDPDTHFVFGEKVQVVLTEAIASSPGGIGLIGGYSWKFNTSPSFANANYYLDGTSYTPQMSPFASASADVNRDGYTDLVVANSGSSSISLFMNVSGTLSTSPSNLTVGSNPQGIVASDIDGDGDVDIITANNTSNNISVLRNDGNGNFAAAVHYNTGTGPRGIAAADMDNDGDIDIVTSNVSGNNVSILLNDGTGIFAAPSGVATGTGPRGIIVEDLDSDGDMDIASCNFGSNNIWVLLNNGNGLLYQSLPYTAGTGPNNMTAFDFDGDGDVDIATANGSSNNVSILVNNGSGVFAAPVNVNSANQPIAIYGNDFDSDQDVDLACVNFSSNNVIIFKNNGSGTFARTDTIATGTGPRSICGIDIGGNGVLELAVANLTAGSVSVLRNQVGGRAIQVTGSSHNFGNVRKNTMARYTLNIANPGADSVLHITGMSTSNPRITLSRTAMNIPAGASDTMTVMFTPEAYGSFSDTLTVFSDADNNPALEIKLTGNSLSAIATSSSGLDFGNVRKDATKQVVCKIKNTDAVNDLVLNSLNVSGPYFSKDLSAPITIPIGDSVSVTISFTPTLSGSFLDTFTIGSNAANGPVLRIPLSGVSQPPAVPQNVLAEAGIGQVLLSWRKNTEDYFMRYRIYGGTAPNPVTQMDSAVDRQDTTKIISGLTNGMTYYFRITALDSSYSESAYSNEASATPDADPAPSSPKDLSATAGNRQITLLWRKNTEDDFLRYRIYAGTSQLPTTLWDSTNAKTDTTKTISGLTNNTAFYFRVAAVDLAGHVSAYSNQVSATPQDLVPPSAPGQLTATAGNSQITVKWGKNTEPDFLRYRIYLGVSQNTTSLWDSSAQRTDTTKTYTGLTNGTVYYIRITAMDSSYNQSGYSNEVNATPASAVSIVTSSVQVTNGNPTAGTNVGISIQVNGTDPSVKLFYGRPGQTPGDSMTMTFNGTAYAATISGTGVTQEGLWYRIRAQNSAGLGYYPTSGTQAIPVQITSLAEIKTISAFPQGVDDGGYFTMALSLNGSLNPVNLFGPQEFIDGGPSNWRVLAFNPSTQSFYDVTTLSGGDAYAIYHKSGNNEDVFSSISNPSAIASDAFNNWILKPGWNLVPWPYTFSANISSTDNAKIGKIWQRSGKGGWEEVTLFKPFGGYMIRNKTASDIAVGSALSWTRSAGKENPISNRAIRFIAESGEYRDAYNFAGTDPSADNGIDDLDESDPFVMGQGVNAYFLTAGHSKLAYDIRSAASEGHLWELVVENTTNHSASKLSWEMGEESERNAIFDITHNRLLELSELKDYTFDNKKPVHFKIIRGSAGWVSNQIKNIESSLPQEFALSQNYPNPFNPETRIRFDMARSGNVTIKIYNILGQEITTLVNGYYETGKGYEAVWNGRDAMGRQASSGLYICRMETGNVSKIRKMLLVK